MKKFKYGDKVELVKSEINSKLVGKIMTFGSYLEKPILLTVGEDKKEIELDCLLFYEDYRILGKSANMDFCSLAINNTSDPTKKEIKISFVDNKTIAEWYEGGVLKLTSVAKCNPKDKFNYMTGSLVAVSRIFGKEYEDSSKQEISLASTSKEEDKKSDIEVGSVVKITDAGMCYSTYASFFSQNDLDSYAPFYAYGQGLSNKYATDFIVVGVGKHSYQSDKILVLKEKTTNAVYLISEEGVKKA